MPIHCVCPNGHALRVKDKLAGKAGKCPTCGADFVVPTADPAGVPLTAATVPEGAAPPLAVAAVAAPAEAVEWRMAWANGEQFGPTVPTVFAQWITAGRVPPDALVWRTGWEEWKPAAQAGDELPAPLPSSAGPPPLPRPGVTLPPASPPPESAVTLAPAEAIKAAATGAYLARRRQQAQRRRVFTIALAVLCLILTTALFLLVNGESAPSATP